MEKDLIDRELVEEIGILIRYTILRLYKSKVRVFHRCQIHSSYFVILGS